MYNVFFYRTRKITDTKFYLAFVYTMLLYRLINLDKLTPITSLMLLCKPGKGYNNLTNKHKKYIYHIINLTIQ